MSNKNELSKERMMAVEEEVSRLNARAVAQRLEQFEKRIHELSSKLEQANNRITQVQQQLALQAQLAVQIAEHGRGPTA